MKTNIIKKYIIWFCIGMYLLSGLMNLGNTISCFAEKLLTNACITTCQCNQIDDFTTEKNLSFSKNINCPCIKGHIPTKIEDLQSISTNPNDLKFDTNSYSSNYYYYSNLTEYIKVVKYTSNGSNFLSNSKIEHLNTIRLLI